MALSRSQLSQIMLPSVQSFEATHPACTSSLPTLNDSGPTSCHSLIRWNLFTSQASNIPMLTPYLACRLKIIIDQSTSSCSQLQLPTTSSSLLLFRKNILLRSDLPARSILLASALV
ncbi:uncharacterized protein UBRO_20668 [Ustilago bromivora]|uniref:Uncharacterized protein n=1 Tax=Ustilago bromivora TaxID=307758 RepID=A0A1K0G4P3_9BASI|nr:uncharacterized protein UBRO_20668 [Ustilago bromivora]